MKKRSIALLMAVVMLFGATVGGTIAWLTTKTSEVKNTFTAADIAIDLTETWNTDSEDADSTPDKWEAKLIPGKKYVKDPVVSVDVETEIDAEMTDVDCILFVKFEEKNNPSTYLAYTSLLNSDNGWTLVNGQSDVWYRIVRTTDSTKSWHLLDKDEVTVKNTVTKTNMADAAKAELVYTAYAIQYEGWEENIAGAFAAIPKS